MKHLGVLLLVLIMLVIASDCQLNRYAEPIRGACSL